MTDIQAAVGIKQLEKLDWLVSQRREIAAFYHNELKCSDFLHLPVEQAGQYSNYQSYSILLKDNCEITRNELMQKLLKKGISTRRGVMTAHTEPAYIRQKVSLPFSEYLSCNSIIIPLYTQENMWLMK